MPIVARKYLFILLCLFTLSEVCHGYSHKGCSLCAQSAIAKSDRLISFGYCLLNLIDREIALRTNEHGNVVVGRQLLELGIKVGALHLVVAMSYEDMTFVGSSEKLLESL